MDNFILLKGNPTFISTILPCPFTLIPRMERDILESLVNPVIFTDTEIAEIKQDNVSEQTLAKLVLVLQTGQKLG